VTQRSVGKLLHQRATPPTARLAAAGKLRHRFGQRRAREHAVDHQRSLSLSLFHGGRSGAA
jgi:hypothetical protein